MVVRAEASREYVVTGSALLALAQHEKVREWLAANPGIHVHFTPTHASWMNMVEIWFSMAERQAMHRGSYRSVRDLTGAIRTYIDGWNDRAHPFTWTKTAEDILAKAKRPETSNTGISADRSTNVEQIHSRADGRQDNPGHRFLLLPSGPPKEERFLPSPT